jgi:glyoxylase-like metal-dependent hydrolase (beta-lactamase superfamily II)
VTPPRPGVYTLRHGTRATRRGEVLLGLGPADDPEAPIVVDYYLWAVVLPDRTILVDTGYAPDVAAARGREVLHDPLDLVTGSLGLVPEAIDTVVLTHAHYDHIGNIARLPSATFHLGATERRFAMDDALRHRFSGHFLEEREVDELRRLDAAGRLVAVDADTELVPGVRLLLAPGHTPGQLMVHVDAAEGGILLASDALHFREELDLDLPFASTMDVLAAYATFSRIAAMQADGTVRHVVPGHGADAFDGMELLAPDVGFLPL